MAIYAESIMICDSLSKENRSCERDGTKFTGDTAYPCQLVMLFFVTAISGTSEAQSILLHGSQAMKKSNARGNLGSS
jgi:hypothetical protein